jgi:hypothetical protein
MKTLEFEFPIVIDGAIIFNEDPFILLTLISLAKVVVPVTFNVELIVTVLFKRAVLLTNKLLLIVVLPKVYKELLNISLYSDASKEVKAGIQQILNEVKNDKTHFSNGPAWRW